MAGFWDSYEPARREGTAPAAPSRQNDTSGVCDLCGFAGDDVLLGVCASCADEEGSRA